MVAPLVAQQMTFPLGFTAAVETSKSGQADQYTFGDVMNGLGLSRAALTRYVTTGCLGQRNAQWFSEEAVAAFVARHYPNDIRITVLNADWIIGMLAQMPPPRSVCPACDAGVFVPSDDGGKRTYDLDSMRTKLGISISTIQDHRSHGCLPNVEQYTHAQIALYVRQHYPACVGRKGNAAWIISILIDGAARGELCYGCRQARYYRRAG